MSIATSLLKANHVGIKDLKAHLSNYFQQDKPLVITDRGTPVKVILSYAETLELLDIIEELTDMETLNAVQQARKAIQKEAKGVPVARLFKKTREARQKT